VARPQACGGEGAWSAVDILPFSIAEMNRNGTIGRSHGGANRIRICSEIWIFVDAVDNGRNGVGLAVLSDAGLLDCGRLAWFLGRGVVIFGSSRPWVRQKAGRRRPSRFEQTGGVTVCAYFVPESLWVSFQFPGEFSQVLNGFSAQILELIRAIMQVMRFEELPHIGGALHRKKTGRLVDSRHGSLNGIRWRCACGERRSQPAQEAAARECGIV
jgi:hypothetical protein